MKAYPIALSTTENEWVARKTTMQYTESHNLVLHCVHGFRHLEFMFTRVS